MNIILGIIAITTLLIIINLLFPQHWLIKILSPYICPNAVYFKTTSQPAIALTIDDSPHPDTTKQILTVLAEYQVVATFFPIANRVIKNPLLIQDIVKAGHEIGNHLTEDEPSIKLKQNFAAELDKAHQILSNFTTVKWLRPGGGWCNQKMIEIAKKYNYRVALGSVWSYDTHLTSSIFASWFILTNTKPGSIIVLHDGEKRGHKTVQTLKKIIPQLQQKGYRFLTLSELDNFS